jgi:BMFP domain-containing protein YqiC
MHKTPEPIDELVKKLLSLIPEGAKNLPKDIEGHFKSALHSAFEKLDLVSREEFDAQVKVLQRTRQKVEELEKALEELEGKKPKKSAKK